MIDTKHLSRVGMEGRIYPAPNFTHASTVLFCGGTMTYAEKLKDPRWQKRRLEVMNDAGFECGYCGEKNETLHIHHPAYRKGAAPWEYKAEELACLCATCHDRATKAQAEWSEMGFMSPMDMVSLLCKINDGVVDEACEMLAEMMHVRAYTTGKNIGFSGTIADVVLRLSCIAKSDSMGTPVDDAFALPGRRGEFLGVLSKWKKAFVRIAKKIGGDHV